MIYDIHFHKPWLGLIPLLEGANGNQLLEQSSCSGRGETTRTTSVLQAQWTSLIVFILLIPLAFLVLRLRYGQPVPVGENPATYGIPQRKEQHSEVSKPDLAGAEGSLETD
ncbi:MAG TPA: hypothetical protein VH593_01390 [Ktedonobacteraceae bacterium]